MNEIERFTEDIRNFGGNKENFKLSETLKKLEKIIEKEGDNSEIQQIAISKEDCFIVKNGMVYTPNDHNAYFKDK
ncbi:TPA: hypothetical protein N2D16_002939 [Clostridium botulinum]|nr:hypothetical protein [Clostridium botulinum]HCL4455003.1 hypothetical protein [Clostridium botulinum]